MGGDPAVEGRIPTGEAVTEAAEGWVVTGALRAPSLTRSRCWEWLPAGGFPQGLEP